MKGIIRLCNEMHFISMIHSLVWVHKELRVDHVYQQVDPDALKSSPLVVPWLRLVQAAVDAEEQNTEAYLKGGQLYFRTIRDISQGEELLVWYDEELSHLLGFSDIKTRVLTDGEICSHCSRS